MSEPPTRRGFTLVEMLVAAVLAGLVAAAAGMVVARQARGFAALATHARAVAEARAAPDVASIARWAAPADLRAAHDSMLELRAFVGAAPACATASPNIVEVDGPSSAAATWLSPPRAGDLALADDDSIPRTVVAVAARASTCAAATATRYALTLDLPLDSARLTTLHLLRDTRLLLYPSADRRWYLGVADRDASGWSTLQPASGPYAAPASTDGAGFRITPLDVAGIPTSSPSATRALHIHSAAIADGPARRGGASSDAIVHLRNGADP
jgi:prepilin-type N-terminal cleavage/methylation domain-containing protein